MIMTNYRYTNKYLIYHIQCSLTYRMSVYMIIVGLQRRHMAATPL